MSGIIEQVDENDGGLGSEGFFERMSDIARAMTYTGMA